VIIPTLNRLETAKLIAGRIKELFPALQTEVIVVSPAAGKKLVADEFLKFVADTGRGVYAAYNTGLRSANGDYVWFMGDDCYPLDASTEITDVLHAGSVDMLIAPVLFSSGR